MNFHRGDSEPLYLLDGMSSNFAKSRIATSRLRKASDYQDDERALRKSMQKVAPNILIIIP